jgi:hypothetical protein
MVESCVVAVQLPFTNLLEAFEVCISDSCDVYVNYSMAGVSKAHTSYHASGQQHTKESGKYVGGKACAMPPREVITREACQDSIAWKVADLPTALYTLTKPADMIVDASGLSKTVLLLFKISVVGDWVREHRARTGFAKIKSHRFGSRLQVEIEAFEVWPGSPTIVSTEAFF